MKSLPNLLIVDDAEVNLFLLEELIKKINVNLIKALSGTEALEKARGLDLALAIVDVRMPGMDGYELAVKLNENRKGDKVPIIFLTASNINETEVFKGYDSGAVDYISKPFISHILISKINIFLDLFIQKQNVIRDAVLLKESADELKKVNSALKKSEEKYRNYIDYAPEGVFVADVTGKFLEVNEAICTTTKYSEDDLLEMSISNLLSEASLNSGLKFLSNVVKTGTSKIELSILDKFGLLRWWSLSAVKFAETSILCFTEEVTQRKRMEEDLKSYQIELEIQNEELVLARDLAEAATNKYVELYDFAPTGYLTLSDDYIIQELNLSAASILGKERLVLKENNFSFFVSKDSLPLFDSFIQEVLYSKTRKTVEIALYTPDEKQKYVLIEGRAVGNSLQCLLNIIDITERKIAEKELHQANIFLDSIIENIPDTVFIKDAKQLRYLRFNRAAEELFGLTKDQILGKSDFESFLKEQAELFNKTDLEVIQTKAMIDIPNAMMRTPNNEVRILHTKKVPILNEQGVPEYLLGIAEDITKRKAVEQTLKVSEEKYRTMLNASPDGIFLIDFNGKITDVSEIGIELFGFDTKEDLIGKHFLSFVPPEAKNTVQEVITKTINEGIAQNIEIRIKKRNQSLFLSEASSTLIQGTDGKPFSFMIIIRDISFRKKMETKQIHADRMANLGEMASGIAHEINQPLNIISMVMDKILFETAKTETVNVDFLKTKSDKIFENIIRIRNIIDHVRAFSKSHDDYVLTAFDVNSCIENATSMIIEQSKYLGITLALNLDKRIPQIVGNTFKLEQVIVNLLTNAKDAVTEKKKKEEGFNDMKINILTYQENQKLIIEINDNGIGVEDEDLHNIMLPFYTTKEEGKGTGLGLSICYQIIKEMNGTIEIISNKPYGTSIKLILDIQKEN